MVKAIKPSPQATCSRCRRSAKAHVEFLRSDFCFLVDGQHVCLDCLTDAENLEWSERLLAESHSRIDDLLAVAPPGWPEMCESDDAPELVRELCAELKREGDLFQSVEDQREMMDPERLRDFVVGVEAALADGTTLDPDQMEFVEHERARLLFHEVTDD